ncbi:alpha/beta hydrolase [Sphingomonas sp. ID1715]|uniref:alpha/beta fold hydrolase n=1 Tax=Sphingomonas sp. ID1715 TaxID=1656898 RepID=UPI001489DAEE|nr:alpha/beta hydrolase [Sphingomonas sp. ID1715]NNM76809.1 alpha/beta hydrolase [Sphingomonas sp. ID1715]
MIFNRRAVPEGATISSWTAADGWPHRTFEWQGGDGRGSILFLGGRGDIFEKYFEAFDHWHRAGWNVASFDWRGQGGSGRLSSDPMCGHAARFAPWIDDLAQFFAEWSARTPGPRIVIAHSMGGHLTLWALSERRIDPDAAVLVAPMLGLKSAPFGARVAARVAALMCRVGKPERLAWKANERPGVPIRGRLALLTHDADRYEDELWWKAQKPEIAVGPPSWAWVAEAYRSTLALEERGRLEHVATPILILAAERDRLVDYAAIRRAAVRLPDARLRSWGPESAHEILREADPVRDAALAEIDRFLADRAPPA